MLLTWLWPGITYLSGLVTEAVLADDASVDAHGVVGAVAVFFALRAVSYTHLTLPTITKV